MQPTGAAGEEDPAVEPTTAVVAAPQPVLPDAAALPDYEQQQAAASDGGLRNARAR
jgi:hypothetical protein